LLLRSLAAPRVAGDSGVVHVRDGRDCVHRDGLALATAFSHLSGVYGGRAAARVGGTHVVTTTSAFASLLWWNFNQVRRTLLGAVPHELPRCVNGGLELFQSDRN
jgi:hypothetical protein